MEGVFCYRMARAYFGSKISPHMLKTPEEFLICYDVPIARTGKQQYLRKELGLKDNPDGVVNVYRTEEEVFDKKTIASFEGKVFTDEHPSDWVTPLNFSTYAKGAVTNVRRGTGKEKDLLLADIIVYNQQQIEEIERKEKREVSCGYECEYTPYKDGFVQSNIVGNHVALVSAGRAGKRVAIKDNDNLLNSKQEVKKNMGYKIPRRSNVSDFLKAVGLKQVAMDSEPEEILDAVNELLEEKKVQEDTEQNVETVKQAEKKVETPAEDEELAEVKETLANVQDALYSLMFRDAEPTEEEFSEDEDIEEGMESLDALESELEVEDEFPEESEFEDADEVEEIRSIEKDPEEMNEELTDGCEEMQSVSDSALELLRVLKPIIANIPDARTRKRVSDNLSRTLRKQVRDSKKKSVYSSFSRPSTVKDSAVGSNPEDLGKLIAEKYNPHYKKEVK